MACHERAQRVEWRIGEAPKTPKNTGFLTLLSDLAPKIDPCSTRNFQEKSRSGRNFFEQGPDLDRSEKKCHRPKTFFGRVRFWLTQKKSVIGQRVSKKSPGLARTENMMVRP